MLPPVGAARGGLRLGKEAPSRITRTHNRPVTVQSYCLPTAPTNPLHSGV